MVLKPALRRRRSCGLLDLFMCTVCNVRRSDGGDQLVKVNRVKQTSKSVRLTEVVRALPVPTILHAPHVTAPLRAVWSARPGDGKYRMLHDEAFRSFIVLCTSPRTSVSLSATGEGVWECAGDARALESSKSLLYLPLPFRSGCLRL